MHVKHVLTLRLWVRLEVFVDDVVVPPIMAVFTSTSGEPLRRIDIDAQNTQDV